MRKILVTTALPYANGPLHLGHLLEHIQSDIWVRAHKMQSDIQCLSICGDDAHGAPIMLKAEQLGITPEALTQEMQQSHEQDFAAFHISYDCYHSTHSQENALLVDSLYQKLQAAGAIFTKKILQAFDPVKKMFLPDRYVKGICPKCGAVDQYGDNCESCGATYAPVDLIDPRSVISGARPQELESEHYFFDLPRFTDLLQNWLTAKNRLQPQILNKLTEWFTAGLLPWDISRDAPYFGFKIPGSEHKYFYVWLDAPIGYMAAVLKYCNENSSDFTEFWQKETTTELYHFIGKDIIYFHALFWPAVLAAANYRLPTAIFAHGFLTINGQKMSKSRGTFIEARSYLQHLNPEYLRYYFAGKLSSSIDDLDLNFTDFTNRINADLVGKVINIASRCAGFINKYFNNFLSDSLGNDGALVAGIQKQKEVILKAYVARDYSAAVRYIMLCADAANQFIDQQKPWVLIKDEDNFPLVQQICTTGINIFRLLMIYLKPILPDTATKVEVFLNCASFNWQDSETLLLGKQIEVFKPLMVRVDKDKMAALLAENQQHGNNSAN